MSFARRAPVARALPDGRVLVIGGDATVLVCEIFDPATGTFSTTGALNTGRTQFAASVLQDGRVLVAGGAAQAAGVTLASAEVWDPATGAWSAVGSMAQTRVAPAATTLQDGTVLVSGGQTGVSDNIFVAAAELFDPASGTFNVTGSLNQARSEHTATRLADGSVVVTGGRASNLNAIESVEIYDPALGTWRVAGVMSERRRQHSAVLLGDGSVLVAGGINLGFTQLASAEIVDPVCMASPAAISPSSAAFTYAGASDIVSVTHVAGCSWRVTGAPAWLTITAGAQGSGSGTVSYSVAANAGTARSATLSIADNAFVVSQEASPCVNPTLNPASQSIAAAGGTSTVSLTIGAGCPWSVSGAPAWLTITGAGAGPADITFTAAPNAGVARSAVFTIAGMSFLVNQAAGACAPAPTISPTFRSFTTAGGTSTVTVTAPAACSWTVPAFPAWITMPTTSGTGNATLSFTVAANPSVGRSAVFAVAGNNFTVSQAANLCEGATLMPASVALPNTAASGTVALTAPASCAWTISGVPSWVSFPSGYSGTGSATLTYQTIANNGPAQAATMTIAGAALGMSQSAGSCWPSSTVSPTGMTFGSAGATFSVNVTAQPGCSWTAWNLPAWITITSPLPQTGSGTVTYSVAANSGAARSASIVIAGASHFVSQAAGPCAGSTISPTSLTFTTAGGSVMVPVTTQAACTWTVTGAPAWITVTSPLPVTGNGSVAYSVAANGGAARSATLVIAGVNHSVSQSGVAPPATYCASRGSSTGFEWIAQTTIAGVARSSGNNGGYADFTASTAIALARGSNAASLVPGFGSGAYTESWRIWIDFNHDSVFSDTEIVYSGASSGTLNPSIVVPASALSGPTRMRVSMAYGGAPPACGTFSYGEVEDYSVIIP